ncbi:type II toxin-antitoxin system Phd/YefM family antitoxin [Petralouisia muris]|jgi:PHD/YefM family antitoxin component YafN of YafNO toxin-antitoxin module|uniref:Type II toxin-antitoxin system Phd/YefM family antitoxin n=1 Tax=Petralouisia muris TaxID=3032872 RepID=A0AC61RTI6_9FIRM|nr:type II toxin-antitoxin system Phd/YefM family antitoxin [Petralouisia muris]TGY95182.1 type II toxin-antitoxin system Phd/YefM family antitoxin [Petralouisia muris]
MSTINITTARKDLYNLVENVNLYSEPALIVGKRGNAVLLSEDDWNAIQETLYLNSIEGMAESILNGAKTPVEDCISEDMVEW